MEENLVLVRPQVTNLLVKPVHKYGDHVMLDVPPFFIKECLVLVNILLQVLAILHRLIGPQRDASGIATSIS